MVVERWPRGDKGEAVVERTWCGGSVGEVVRKRGKIG